MTEGSAVTTKPHRLARADIGAWVFTANPASPEARSALGGKTTLDERCVRRSYRADLIEPGDAAVLWVSGSRTAPTTPGIWMTGHITTEVRADVEGDEETGRPSVGVRLRLLEKPLAREQLTADRRTSSIEVIARPWMSNPSYLTPTEWAAVEALLAPARG